MAHPQPQTQGQTRPKQQPDPPRPWNVVLLDDDDHTYEYVIRMVQRLFGHPFEKAFAIAKTVDGQGRAVCTTTHKELAELKRDQILAFGADPLSSHCKGSMTSIIEPAEFGGDDDNSPGSGEQRMTTRPAQSPLPAAAQRPATQSLRPWNVILFNDEEHSFEYVVSMLQNVFGFSSSHAYRITLTAHTTGRAVCLTTHLELAELKRDQILARGPDPHMSISRGPCRSIIEPAADGDDPGR